MNAHKSSHSALAEPTSDVLVRGDLLQQAGRDLRPGADLISPLHIPFEPGLCGKRVGV